MVNMLPVLSFIKIELTYGRYWGCNQFWPMPLRAGIIERIDFAIEQGLAVIAGAQGDHKIARVTRETCT